jgi:hypothetical protein
MPKTVVHVFHDDDAAVVTGTRVAQRILEVAPERGIEVEVFCFGPAQRRLGRQDGDADLTFNRQVDELVVAGVVVGACVNTARADGTDDDLRARGLSLEVARDAFVRFTLEGATVLSF